jgi:hypothetical protein
VIGQERRGVNSRQYHTTQPGEARRGGRNSGISSIFVVLLTVARGICTISDQ